MAQDLLTLQKNCCTEQSEGVAPANLHVLDVRERMQKQLQQELDEANELEKKAKARKAANAKKQETLLMNWEAYLRKVENLTEEAIRSSLLEEAMLCSALNTSLQNCLAMAAFSMQQSLVPDVAALSPHEQDILTLQKKRCMDICVPELCHLPAAKMHLMDVRERVQKQLQQEIDEAHELEKQAQMMKNDNAKKQESLMSSNASMLQMSWETNLRKVESVMETASMKDGRSKPCADKGVLQEVTVAVSRDSTGSAGFMFRDDDLSISRLEQNRPDLHHLANLQVGDTIHAVNGTFLRSKDEWISQAKGVPRFEMTVRRSVLQVLVSDQEVENKLLVDAQVNASWNRIAHPLDELDEPCELSLSECGEDFVMQKPHAKRHSLAASTMDSLPSIAGSGLAGTFAMTDTSSSFSSSQDGSIVDMYEKFSESSFASSSVASRRAAAAAKAAEPFCCDDLVRENSELRLLSNQLF
jgi:hypothetical protein